MGGQNVDKTKDQRILRARDELLFRMGEAPAGIAREIAKVLESIEKNLEPNAKSLARVLVWVLDTEHKRRRAKSVSPKRLKETSDVVSNVVLARVIAVKKPEPVPVDEPDEPEEEDEIQRRFRMSLGIGKSRTTIRKGKTVVLGDKRRGDGTK